MRLSPKLEARLNRLTKRAGRPKAYHAKKALKEFLDEQEDDLIAVSRLDNKLAAIPLEKVARRLGLDLLIFNSGSQKSRNGTAGPNSGISTFVRERVASRASARERRKSLISKKQGSGAIESVRIALFAPSSIGSIDCRCCA